MMRASHTSRQCWTCARAVNHGLVTTVAAAAVGFPCATVPRADRRLGGCGFVSPATPLRPQSKRQRPPAGKYEELNGAGGAAVRGSLEPQRHA